MNTPLKRIIERTFNCRIYRNFQPRCLDLFYDLDQLFGSANFQTVFDVGANVGQSALKYVQAFPSAEIDSFEPVAGTYQTLLKNTAGLNRIHPFHLALGDAPREETINLNQDSTTNSIVHNQTGIKETIQVETLDGFLAAHRIETIDFMKTDTEGFELKVLQGARTTLKNHRIGLLSVECEPVKTGRPFAAFAEVAEYLLKFEYELFGIYEQQPHWTGEKSILYFNPVFICPELAATNATPNHYPLCPSRGDK